MGCLLFDFFAQYENEVSILGKWTNKGPTMTRPKFSDETGQVEYIASVYPFQMYFARSWT